MYKTLVRLRAAAFAHQQGRCFYCQLPIWLDDLSGYCQRYEKSTDAAIWFQCTAEHVVARQDGGKDTEGNIVAACAFCNQHRHRRKKSLSSERFSQLVKKRIAQRKWNVGLGRSRSSPTTVP